MDRQPWLQSKFQAEVYIAWVGQGRGQSRDWGREEMREERGGETEREIEISFVSLICGFWIEGLGRVEVTFFLLYRETSPPPDIREGLTW